MKISPPRRKSGFTLVELLVVIMIIASLASMGFAVVKMALGRSEDLKAKKACTDLVMACESFEIDHNGMWPLSRLTAAEGQDEVLKTEDNDLMAILLNKEGEGDAVNQKGQAYFSAEVVNRKSNGIYMKDESIALYDPWGRPYTVIIDTNGDGQILDPKDPAKQRMISKRVVVYSMGPDQETGEARTMDDNIYSY